MDQLWKERARYTKEQYCGRTIAIYGAGKMARTAIDIAEEISGSIVVCDKAWESIGYVGNYPVLSPEILNGNRQKYYVMVSIRYHCEEVRQLLESYGYERERDYCYYALPEAFYPAPEGYTDFQGNQIIGDLHQVKVRFEGSNSCIEVQGDINTSGLSIVCRSNVHVVIGKNLRLTRSLWTFYDNAVCTIGDNCFFAPRNEICMLENSCIEIGCDGKFGERNKFLLSRNTNLSIGKEALFSKFVSIRPGDGHPIYDLVSGQKFPEKDRVIIHDHVWFGEGVIVLGNSEIGTGCIAGAQSLVKGVFPNNCMIAGQLARIIRTNVAWSRTELEHGLDDLAEEYRQFTRTE